MSNIVELAEQILAAAKKFQAQIDEEGRSGGGGRGGGASLQPTFDAGGPTRYIYDNDEVYETRAALVDLSETLADLARGPIDTLKNMLHVHKMNFAVLRAIDHHNLPDLVPREGGSSIALPELAEKAGVDEDLLERTLRYAYTARIFHEPREGQVAHTALSLAIPELSPWLRLMASDIIEKGFMKIDQLLQEKRDGGGGERTAIMLAYGDDRTLWDHLHSQPDGMTKFSDAMKCFAMQWEEQLFRDMISSFDWAHVGNGRNDDPVTAAVVDVGGGNGYVATRLARTFPGLSFVVQDLPSNEKLARENIPPDLADRVAFQAQDFFTPQPPGTTVTTATGLKATPAVYLMKSILHDWPDVDCVRILKNLIPGMENGARLFVVDRVLPLPGRILKTQEASMRHADMLMMITLNAKERSEREWENLFTQTDPRLKINFVKTSAGQEWGMIEVVLRS